MKTRLVIISAALALSLCLPGCAPAAGEASVELSCDEFMELQPDEHPVTRELEVAAGESFTITLCSNPTTGFEWEPPEITDEGVVELLGSEFEAPAPGAPPGAAGKEIWTFRALKKGTSTISMQYSRLWEGGEKGVWKFALTVVVS